MTDSGAMTAELAKKLLLEFVHSYGIRLDIPITQTGLYLWTVDLIKAVEAQARAKAIEECAKAVENWRCNKNDKCYPCDCGGEVPQEAIPSVIRALASKREASSFCVNGCKSEKAVWYFCPEHGAKGEAG